MKVIDISGDPRPREVSFNDFHVIDHLLQDSKFSRFYKAMQDDNYHSWVVPGLVEAGLETDLGKRGITLPFAVIALMYHGQLRPSCGFAYLMDVYEHVLEQEPDAGNVAHLVTALKEGGQEAEHLGKLLRLKTPIQSFIDNQEPTIELKVGARIYGSVKRYNLIGKLFPADGSTSVNLLD